MSNIVSNLWPWAKNQGFKVVYLAHPNRPNAENGYLFFKYFKYEYERHFCENDNFWTEKNLDKMRNRKLALEICFKTISNK